MNLPCLRRLRSIFAGVTLAALAAGLLPGCRNIFIPRHKVLVDAISSVGAEKPTGKSYKLVAKRSVVSAIPVQVPVVKACVDAALAGQGMFEAPPNVPPDMFIEVSYGRDTSARVDAGARETFLQLSARANPERSMDKATGPELWDVKVAVLGVAGAIETAMPLLSAVAANHLASDTRIEMKVDIPQNSPIIESVRSSAIKTLEVAGQPQVRPPVVTPTAAPLGVTPGSGRAPPTGGAAAPKTGDAPVR